MFSSTRLLKVIWFTFWQAGVSKWFGGNLWIRFKYSMIRKGEGSLFTPWDAPWFAYTVEQGYSEPFPTGIVEKRNEFGFSFKYYPSIHWGVEGEFSSLKYRSKDHMLGQIQNEIIWKLGLWMDGDLWFRVR